jgi:diadenosine tetraphosphatase ApaH/serine/threonine PP2A family protein phosphatase
MRLGIVSDIHGNLDALETVIEAAGPTDGWICLGDTVGYGPQPNECVERIRELCQITLIGNHDLAAIGRLDISWFNPFARAAALWTRDVLSSESRTFLEGLPETSLHPEWNATFAHGSLTDPPRDYITTVYEARANFRLLETQTLFIGHSHLSEAYSTQQDRSGIDQEDFASGHSLSMKDGFRYIINCGSVGQPRDGDPRAAFGVFDTEARVVTVGRTPYDIERVQAKMMDAELPRMLADRLALGR